MTFVSEMMAGLGHIVKAPFQNMETLWVLIPLFLLWIILEVYFGRYKNEKLGWNTALANGITLGWLTLEGLRALFEQKPDQFWFRLLVNLLILTYALLIIYFSFTHKVKSKFNFIIASPTPIYYLGIISVLWGTGALEINRYVLLDLILLYIVIALLFKLFRHFIKPAENSGSDEGDMGGDLGKDVGGDLGKDDFKMPDFDKDLKMPDLGKDDGMLRDDLPPLGKI